MCSGERYRAGRAACGWSSLRLIRPRDTKRNWILCSPDIRWPAAWPTIWWRRRCGRHWLLTGRAASICRRISGHTIICWITEKHWKASISRKIPRCWKVPEGVWCLMNFFCFCFVCRHAEYTVRRFQTDGIWWKQRIRYAFWNDCLIHWPVHRCGSGRKS